MIEGVTKLKATDVQGRPTANEQVETVRKIFTLMQNDIRIMVIKLMDRLHNMKTIQFLKPERQKTNGNVDAERERLRKEIARAEQMLANERFVSKAPPEVVAAEREKLDRYRRELDAIGG